MEQTSPFTAMTTAALMPLKKRARIESVANRSTSDVESPPESLLSLPNEALAHILSFERPKKECQVWEWIGKKSAICTSIRRVAQGLAPIDFTLEDFKMYPNLDGRKFDARSKIIKSLCRFDWMRSKLQEMHVTFSSVREAPKYFSDVSYSIDSYIISILRSLITAPNSLPQLKWLDINVQDGFTNHCDLVDSDTLLKLPFAVPYLRNLCLCGCFWAGKGMENEVSPGQLKTFFSLLPNLTSLSLMGPRWMTDEHVATIMPIVGNRLRCLEIIDCRWGKWDELMKKRISDTSLESIAKHTRNLVSFSIADSDVTTAGLEKVFKANPDIATLNLSYCEKLDERTISVISQNLMQLTAFRCYWSTHRYNGFGGTRNDLWINDDTLNALVEAQERESETSFITLEVLGILKRDNLSWSTLSHVMQRGVDIEIDMDHNEDLCVQLDELEIEAADLHHAKYCHFVDGSRNSQTAVVNSISDRSGLLDDFPW